MVQPKATTSCMIKDVRLTKVRCSLAETASDQMRNANSRISSSKERAEHILIAH